MTTETCEHGDLIVEAGWLPIDGVPFVHVDVRCGRCNEPYRFRGVNVGIAVTGPMVTPDGTELRVPIEPISAQAAREARVVGSARYCLEVRRFQQSTPAVGMQEVTELVAHDQWNLGEGCAEAIAALEEPVYKPAIPAAYHACERCLAAARASFVEEALGRADIVIEETLDVPTRAWVNGQEVHQGEALAVDVAGNVSVVGGSAVIPLEAQEGDDEPDEDEDTAAEPGEPVAPAVRAQAAVLLVPDTAPADSDAPPTGQIVTRPRPARGNRGGR